MIYRVNALFTNHDEAARAVQLLREHNFEERELTIISKADEASTAGGKAHARDANKKAGGWTGTALGAAVGGYVGLLSMVLIPALPLFIAGGAALGGALGSMTGLGVGDEQLKQVEQTLRSGGALVVVTDGDEERVRRAEKLLQECNASSVSFSERVPDQNEAREMGQARDA